MKISEIHINKSNPRFIKDERFKKLVTSIKDFPKMMSLRPIVIDAKGIILGGNMRYRAIKELGYKEIPDIWLKQADDLTEEERKRFIIEDNIPFGEWDYDILANEWDAEQLTEWGMELPELSQNKQETQNLNDFQKCHILISYHPNNHMYIIPILEKLSEIDGFEIEMGSN